jgi:hypothetical protein
LIPNERGQLESKELGLWVGTWEGRIAGDEPNVWVRFFEPSGQVVLTAAETEQQRAEAAEAEVARLKAQLAAVQGQPAPDGGAPH